MVFKEILQKLGEKNRERKEMIRQMDQQLRARKLVEDRQKSANERELEKYMDEEREEKIKEALEVMRKRRQEDINFGHNPLDVPNITSKTEWEVLKERNLFADNRPTIFKGDGSVLKSNKNLLKNNMKLLR